ncbi:concanavalin A-like lectin/glucanase domain-containing protein [Fennellomyces sp. T-0311]|nr:concanavalin A-like lectin/glucanase domain-containing protein [Fennellomyces sp. T-0311]
MSSFASLSPAIAPQAGPSSYSTAFPPLQSSPWSFPHYNHNHHKKHAQHHNQHPALYQSLAPPKYPSYLKHTLYADLALEQYNYYQNRRSFFPSDHYKHHYEPMPTLAESCKSQGAPPEEMDLRLPTCWNQKDKSRHIEIGRNGLDLSYIGPGKNESHAASIRANFPMRRQCGIYYYEMHVISKGDDGFIGVGFCSGDNELERLPGWDSNSYGYHGDDGHSFAGSGTGKTYGPCFSTGDVVGCGVNFAEGTAFYTKNGSFLGNAFEGLFTSDTTDYYPCIGLRTPGEHVTVNFGNEPFVFDIIQYIKVPSREKFAVPRPNKKVHDTSEKLDQLVLSYLIHHGYTGAAKAVIRDSKHVSGKTLGLTNSSYTNDQDLEQRHSNMHIPAFTSHATTPSMRVPGRRRLSYAAIAASASPTNTNGNGIMSMNSNLLMESELETEDDDDDHSPITMKRIMKYGQQLQDEYRHDDRPKIRERLVEIFSLLAYPDVGSSPVAHLMNKSGRDELATDLNAAILCKCFCFSF